MKAVAISKLKVGRWARVIWDCIGAQDGIITSIDRKNKWVSMLWPYEKEEVTTAVICFDQIIKVGNKPSVKESVLDD